MATEPSNFSAFRVQERKYKQRIGSIDLSTAIDLHNPAGRLKKVYTFRPNDGRLIPEITVYESVRFPGLFLLPRALSTQAQWNLAYNALFKWTQRTNLDTHYDFTKYRADSADDISALLQSVISQIQSKENEYSIERKDAIDGKAQTPLEIIKKLRWGLLGMEYDWLAKEYTSLLNAGVPNDIEELCNLILCSISSSTAYGSHFKPQVGIVNFYKDKDTLTAHVDRSESNMEAPLISFNVGKSCIFLMGSETIDVEPEALIIHSGDVLVMSKDARKAFHGVPRILETNKLEIDEKYLSNLGEEKKFFIEYMKETRINMNFREVK